MLIKFVRWGSIWGLVLLVAGVSLSCRSQEAQPVSMRLTPASAIVLPVVPPTPRAVVAFEPAEVLADALTTSPRRFRIGRQARSQQDALLDVVLLVRTALLDNNTVTLDIALQNVSDHAYALTGELSTWLEDAGGRRYDPLQIDESIRVLDAADGFVPGGAILGNIRFPLPGNPEPYILHVLDYEPVTIRLDTPLVEPQTEHVPLGAYLLDLDLFSEQEALAPIRLRIGAVEVGETEFSLQVAFRNTLFQSYDVTGSITGQDAVLLGTNGEQYHPLSVSPTLTNRITPEGGWQPQEEHSGTITFARPSTLNNLRFIFPLYSPATIDVEASGTARGWLTSAAGGMPVPTPTPDPALAAKRTVTDMLAQQAHAVLAGDAENYLDSFVPELGGQQQSLFARLQRVPFTAYEFQVDPDQVLQPTDENWLRGVRVLHSYSLAGLPNDNVFHHDLSLDLVRRGSGWQIEQVQSEPPFPFWQDGEFVRADTAHFLLFRRPDSSTDEAVLAEEVETAYSTLLEHGLPLESRYVAYFSGPDESFSDLTGITTGRLQGVALSRFETKDDEIVVVNRAFYINGQTLDEEAHGLWPDARLSTITHELVHLALAQDSRPFTPPWLTEGLAVYYADQGGLDRRRRLQEDGHLTALSLGDLTGASSLGEHETSGERASYEYIYSGSVISYLVELYGEQSVLDFYRSYALLTAEELRGRIPDVADQQQMDVVFKQLSQELTQVAVQTHFGLTLEQLDENVKAWLDF